MSDDKELVLFVPGMGRNGQSRYVALLLANLQAYCADRGIAWNMANEHGDAEKETTQITLGLPDGTNKTIDLKTVYWSQLLPSLDSASVPGKIWNGLALFKYWVFSCGIWQKINDNKYLMLQTIMTIFFMFVWYYGVAALGIMALGSSTGLRDTHFPQWFLTLCHAFGLQSLTQDSDIGLLLQGLGASMGGFYAIVTASVVIKTIDVTAVANTLYATKEYLQNVNGIKDSICAKLGKGLLAAQAKDTAYTRVTVFAHSIGAVIAVEVLAALTEKPKSPIRCITAGSPLLLLAARSDTVRAAVARLQESENILAWQDYYAQDDWLCSAIPVFKDSPRVTSRKISSTAPVFDILAGKSHDLYFADAMVHQALLAG